MVVWKLCRDDDDVNQDVMTVLLNLENEPFFVQVTDSGLLLGNTIALRMYFCKGTTNAWRWPPPHIYLP